MACECRRGAVGDALRLFRGVHLGGALVRIEDYGVRIAVITGLCCGLVDGDVEHTAGIGCCFGAVCADGASSAPVVSLRQRFGVMPMESLPSMLRRFVLACGVLFGGSPAPRLLLHQQLSGWIGLSVLILSIWQLRRRVDAVPLSRMTP